MKNMNMIFCSLLLINIEEPEWIEVITELLLSLMFKGSILSRNIAKTAMGTLAGHVTVGALHLVLDVSYQALCIPCIPT